MWVLGGKNPGESERSGWDFKHFIRVTKGTKYGQNRTVINSLKYEQFFTCKINKTYSFDCCPHGGRVQGQFYLYQEQYSQFMYKTYPIPAVTPGLAPLSQSTNHTVKWHYYLYIPPLSYFHKILPVTIPSLVEIKLTLDPSLFCSRVQKRHPKLLCQEADFGMLLQNACFYCNL